MCNVPVVGTAATAGAAGTSAFGATGAADLVLVGVVGDAGSSAGFTVSGDDERVGAAAGVEGGCGAGSELESHHHPTPRRIRTAIAAANVRMTNCHRIQLPGSMLKLP